MIVVEAWMTTRPEAAAEFAAAARELVTATRTEEAYQAYTCAQVLDEPHRFLFVEHWPDKTALAKHAATDHYLGFAALAKDWVVDRSVLIHEVAEAPLV